MTKMHVAMVEHFKKPLVLREWDVPIPGAGQILVKTEACGVCHTLEINAARFAVRLTMRVAVLSLVLTSVMASAAAGAADTLAVLPDSRTSVLSGEQVVRILDETVEWYRTLGTQQQNADQLSDLLIVYANRQTADKVVALAFEIARANAELLSSDATASDCGRRSIAAGAESSARSVGCAAAIHSTGADERETA